MRPFQKIDYNAKPLKIFFRYFAPHRRLFFIDMLCAVLAAGIDLVFPLVSRASMQTYLPQGAYRTFFIVMAVLIAAYVGKALLYYVITVVGHGMGVMVEADMRRDLFNHLQELSFSFFDRNRTGVLMSRVTSDLFDITELAHHGPENILTCGLTIIGAIAVMFTIQWKLALVLLVIVPLAFGLTIAMRGRMMRTNIEVKKKTAAITAAIESGVSGIRTAKAFANEDEEARKFDESNDRYRKAKRGYYGAMGAFMASTEFCMGIMPVVVIAAGGIFIMGGELDYIDLVTFSLYVSTFIAPVRKLAMFMEMYVQGKAGYSRFLEIMRTQPEIRDAPDAIDLPRAQGAVEYRNVSFSYGDGSQVLKDVNLSIRPGESFALVGPSGGGKTTMCHLLPRFYDVSEGAVLVDGHDVRSLTQRSLRQSIGIIQQDVFMFAGTIRENIRYGRPEASDMEVEEAARRAEIHEEIMTMPEGYDTYIGERGVMLSGGQKQRLSIARVFLKNPPILILDEATSALDSVTEQRIQASLEELSQGRTCIIIAHRLSTIRSADRIAVVEDEGIVELGTHAELMAKGGAYAALQEAQQLAV